MPRYPELDMHCPIEGRIGEVLDGSFCRRCRTTVHDLDALDEASRLRLMAGTQGDVCVRYRMPPFAAAALIAAGIGASPAAAQDTTPAAAIAAADQSAPAPEAAPAYEDTEIVGVMSRPTPAQRARWLREARRAERQARAEQRRADAALEGGT